MTQSEIDAARLDHWRSSARDLRIIKFFAGAFGALIVLGLVGIGEARQRLEHQAQAIEESKLQLAKYDERIRANERSRDGVAATLSAQAEMLTEILAEQRAMRQLLLELARRAP